MFASDSCPMVSADEHLLPADDCLAFGGNFSASVFKVMIAIDAAALSFWLADRLTTAQAYAIHLSGACLLVIVVALFDRRAILQSLVDAGICILAGPLGTLVLQVAQLSPFSPAAKSDHRLDEEHGSVMPVSLPDAIHEMHLQGRRSVLGRAEDQSYADILRDDDLLRHNEVIAAISRNYEPEMYPTLSLALGSSSPALKVQAAAVYSKLRRTLGESANDLLATDLSSFTPKEALDHHNRMLNVARSGFVDPRKAQALITRADQIERTGLLAGVRPAKADSAKQYAIKAQRDLRQQTPRLKRYSCGGLG